MWTTGVPGVWPIPKSTAAPGGGWAQRQVASDSLRGHWYVGEGGRDAGPVPGRSSTLKTPNKKPGAKKGWIVWGLRKYMFYKCCFTSVGPGDTKAQFWIYKVWLWDTSGAMFIKQTILKHKNLIFWNCGESHEIFRDPACFFLVCDFKKVDAMWRGSRSWTMVSESVKVVALKLHLVLEDCMGRRQHKKKMDFDS